MTRRWVMHCSHWGAYHILVEDGQVVGVEPFEHDPAPSPINGSVLEWAQSDRRIQTPLVRAAWLDRRDGKGRRDATRDKFVPIGWDEALELVAGEIRRVATAHGNESIFAGSYGWTSCGRFHHASSLLKRTLNLVGGFTGHVDTYSIAAGPVILRHTLGDERACNGQANTLDTIAAHTKTLVVFGALSPRTAQNEAGGMPVHSLESHLRRLVERGVRIVLVSPLRDDLPDWVDCEWWPIRPNTDAALMLGLAGELLRHGWHDQDFLDRCTSGSDRLLASLDGSADGTVRDAAWAAEITGLDAGAIRALARRLVETRSMLTVSWSLQRAHHGEQPFWAALALAAMAGQIGLPGGGVGYGYGSLGGVGAPLNLARSPAMPQLAKPIRSFIPVARISDMLLNPGGRYTYEGEVRTYPDIRLVFWAGGNPYHHHQDLNRLQDAWDRPDTIIVQDPMFTASAQRADIVLPATSSIERNDIAGNRRSGFIIAMHKAIEPVGESRSDFDIFRAIAAKLGVQAAFDEGRDEMGWLRHLYDETRDDSQRRLGFEMPDFDAFWETGYARCSTLSGHTYLDGFREQPERHPLKTSTGRILLGSDALAALDYDDCRAHPAWIEPLEWLGQAGAADRFHLISNQPEGRLHSQLDASPASMAHKRDGRERVLLHPDDAGALGIRDGQTVRLWNGRGACLAAAELTDRVRRRVAVLSTGAWFTPTGNDGLDIAGNPNAVTPDIGTSAFGQGCSAHTCLVSIEPFSGKVGDAQRVHRLAAERLLAV